MRLLFGLPTIRKTQKHWNDTAAPRQLNFNQKNNNF
jgi:hypothetical protein